jgi:acetyl esterase/lipase
MNRPPALIAFLLLCLSFPLVMEGSDLIPRERLFGNPSRTQARISPLGTHLSYIAPVEGVMNVWVAPVDDIAAAEPLTFDRGRGISRHFWAGNNTHILFLQDRGGDENWRLHSLEVATKTVRDLTPFTGTATRLYKSSLARPDEMLIGLNNRNASYHDVWKVNVVTGDLTFVYQNEEFRWFVADEDLRLRIASKPQADGGMNYLRRTEDGSWEDFFTVASEDAFNTGIDGFTRDGSHLILRSSQERDTSALLRMEVASGESAVLGENPRADIVSVLSDPLTGEPLAYSANYLVREWTAIDPALEPDLRRLARLPGEFQILSVTRDLSRWIVFNNRTDRSGTYFLYDRASGALRELFETRPELAAHRLRPMHPVEITARDGLKLVSYYTLPAAADPDDDGRAESPSPLVLYVHGGPWSRDSYGYDTIHQWLANRGFAVLSVNYRGSTGFGKNFISAATHQFAGAMHDDLIDAVDWAIAEGLTARDTVAIMGGSYGGYATLVGMTFTPDRFAAGVDIVGPSNLVTLIESFPAYWKPFLDATWYSRVGNPAIPEDRERLLAQSPITRVDAIRSPLLIGQGANDPRVVQNESDQLVAKMEAKGLPVTYVLFPDEGHGFARPENRMAFYAVTESFLGGIFDRPAEPIGHDLRGSSLGVPSGAEHIDGLPEALADFEPVVRH